ncbi:hypothetical protein Bca4012_066494 [Brassica carinata]
MEEDMFNRLPNPLISHILSFLPTKEAASTSILSKRWRLLFASVTNLDLEGDEDSPSFVGFVDRLLALQGNAKLKRFSLNFTDYPDPVPVTTWILNVLRRGDSELELSVSDYPLPPEIFVSKTLLKLKLEGGDGLSLGTDVGKYGSSRTSTLVVAKPPCVNETGPPLVIWPSPGNPSLTYDLNLSHRTSSVPLNPWYPSQPSHSRVHLSPYGALSLSVDQVKTLEIESVEFEGDGVGFEKLLSGCPVLEELVLVNLGWEHWKSCCSVSAKSLRKLKFFCEDNDGNPKSVSFDTPNLVYLEYSDNIAKKYPRV